MAIAPRYRVASGAPAALRRTAVVTAALLALVSIPAACAADAADKNAAAAAKPESKPQTAALPSLAEILIEAERSDSLEHEVRKRFGDLQRLKAAEENIAAVEAALADAAKAVDPRATERLQVLALIDLALEIRAYIDKVGATARVLETRARAYDADLDRIGAIQKQWSQRIDAARSRNAPEELLQRLEPVPQRLKALADDVTARRNAIVLVMDRATRLRGRMASMLVEAIERRDRLIDSLSSTQVEPLWRTTPQPGASQLAHTWVATELTQLRGYIARHESTLAWIAGLGFLASLGLLMAARRALASDPNPDEDSALAQRLFRRPLLAAMALTLVVVIWQAPEAPVVFFSAALTLLFMVSTILARLALGHHAMVTLYALAAALIVNWFQGGIDALPFSGRMVLIIQCAAVAASLWIDMRHGRMSHAAQLLPPQVMRMIAWAAIGLLGAAIVANVIGDLGLARQMRDGVLRTLGFALVVNVSMRLLHGFVLALLLSWVSRWSRIVQYRAGAMRTAMRVAMQLFAVATWIAGSLLSFKAIGFLDWVQDAVDDAKIEIGTVTISANAVLLCLAVVVGTWAIVKLTRLVLELELLSRLSLSSATAFVISATVRYVLTVAGFILAMAALGIDFSKVTLLVSAIGVGIGFGLQNVVNNFVSGLLLLGERVINVGDTVQVGSLTGVVRRIGVRSSTVRTFPGAEVIVPNSDLTSKEVINFTLSDRHRRLDITVGVDYGSDPDKVQHLLLDAARSQPQVLQTLPPVAAFVGFGESSLDFRLQAWIANYEEGLAVETALRMAILARLREAGIGIPYPQRDVNIRAMAGPIVPQAGPSG